MKSSLHFFTLFCVVVGIAVTSAAAGDLAEVGGVYEMPKGYANFAEAWGNSVGVKIRVATQPSATDNLGLTFCWCRYPAAASSFQYDATMISVGLSQKSTFHDDAKIRPYIKGEAGLMQVSDVWRTTHDRVTGSALHTKVQDGHSDSYLAGHMGLVFDVVPNYQIFVETGFLVTLQGQRKKVIPIQMGVAFHR